MTNNITQEDVDILSKQIKNNIENLTEFLKTNYTILKKKKQNTNQEIIFIKNLEDNNLFYQSPESIELFIDTICFYIALEKLGISYKQW